MPGSGWIELILWFCYLIPGVIYSLWRRSGANQHVCPVCRTPNMIPLDSPAGKAIAEAYVAANAPRAGDSAARLSNTTKISAAVPTDALSWNDDNAHAPPAPSKAAGWIKVTAALFAMVFVVHFIGTLGTPEKPTPSTARQNAQSPSVKPSGPSAKSGSFLCATVGDLVKISSYVNEGNQTAAMEMLGGLSPFSDFDHGCIMVNGGSLRIVSADSGIARVEYGKTFGYMATSQIDGLHSSKKRRK